MDPTELGAYLTEKRKEKGLSIYRLSKLSNVSHSYISQLERGIKEQPSPEILKKLSNALGIDYGSMMYRAGYIGKAAVWLYEDDEIEEEVESKVLQQAVQLLQDNSIDFQTKKHTLFEWLSEGEITELKDFLSRPNITFGGVPIDDYYRQRILDILNGLFWEDIRKLTNNDV